MRILLMVVLVSCMGMGGLYRQTDGFTVLTTEAARRNDIERNPRVLPDAIVQDQLGVAAPLLSRLRNDGRLTVVTFLYTRCFSLCLATGSELAQLQAQIKEQRLADRVRLLGVSFDPTDTPARLTRYAQNLRADSAVWRFAVIPDAAQRNALLDVFGVVVVPAPQQQFEHNAAFHLVAPDGRLMRIVDIDEGAVLLDEVSRWVP